MLFTFPTVRDLQARTKAFLATNPGWTFRIEPNGRRFTASGADSREFDVPGATLFLRGNAAALGIEPAEIAKLEGVDEAHRGITFGHARWGKWDLGAIMFRGGSLSGVYLGPLGAPPAEMEDTALIQALRGRKVTVIVSTRRTPRPCDPGPNRSGCAGDPGPPSIHQTTMTLDETNVRPLGHEVRGVQASPTTWELRVIARFAPKPPVSGDVPDPTGGTRVESTVSYQVDGEPSAPGLVVDATTGEDLTGRAIVF